ncbi:MAG: reverse transcriptase/maturase family protein [Nanoarchaeota archaeon]
MEKDFDLFNKLCSYENLELAFRKARKRKTLKHYVIEFERSLKQNILDLRNELIFHAYKPRLLKTFIVRDPKTRKISKSHFRDRVIHHALCNIIEPIFEKSFIHDSYANRINKGSLKAIERFDYFKRKVSKNNSRVCYVLKADIKSYFERVNHEILLNTIRKKIKDERIIWLITIILQNHRTSPIGGGRNGIGMPLGNLTSQFFANIYLDELDQFVKHELKSKYYIRYVDDFIILHHSKNVLAEYKTKINEFLKTNS